jgi:hypothetical protein
MKHWLLLAFLMAAPSAWAINKCTQPDGRVVYQEAACEGGRKVDVSAAGRGTTAGGAKHWSAELAAVDHRIRVREAINRGEPVVGMSEAELQQAMGAPTRANLGDYEGQRNDQLIYERPGRTWYVYVQDGRVRSVQTSLSGRRGAPAQEHCPAPLTLRNMETSAASRSLGDEERAERLREIGEIRQRCGY